MYDITVKYVYIYNLYIVFSMCLYILLRPNKRSYYNREYLLFARGPQITCTSMLELSTYSNIFLKTNMGFMVFQIHWIEL